MTHTLSNMLGSAPADRLSLPGGGTITGAGGYAMVSGNLLVGGLTTNGTGVLQFPAGTTSAGGIAFGADTFLFRNTAGRLSLAHTSRPQFDLEVNGAITGAVFASTGGMFLDSAATYPIIFRTNGTTTSLVLAADQSATFSSTVATSAPVGGAGAWELGVANAVTPTSPNRTITIEIGGTAYYLHAKTTND